jgi:hypothetical protein
MTHAIFGYPHGDPLNSYYDREAREGRYQAAKLERERFGEAGPRGSGRRLRLPTEDELSQSFSERAIQLPTLAELEREAETQTRVDKFRDWLAMKATELGLDRK